MESVDLFKALADTNRLRILSLLDQGPLCVCDLESVLGLQQSNLSRHLAKLKQAGLVTSRKKGLFIYYSRRPVEGPYGSVLSSLYSTLAANHEWPEDRTALAGRYACDPDAVARQNSMNS